MIASRTRSLKLLLGRAGLQLPDVVTIAGEEVRARRLRGRPHIDLYVAAASKMHIPIDRCAVVLSHLGADYDTADLHRFAVILHSRPHAAWKAPVDGRIAEFSSFPSSLTEMEELCGAKM